MSLALILSEIDVESVEATLFEAAQFEAAHFDTLPISPLHPYLSPIGANAVGVSRERILDRCKQKIQILK